uniref:EF-hand domain-containing protein n=1 Tax=Hemiselmis andersenii TaxID=464988 RepID=A0A6T8PPK7_HEMAN|mmetsp:Transcript_25760/g.59766  ORF Transcript_25760/g.59766 Transcript_25760/m.59766 type:complete len:186 (-) Transcript_25760:277-834(-)
MSGLTKEENQVIMRARSLKSEIAEVVQLSHSTIEAASGQLADYYKTIPHGELSDRIRMSFNAFDSDKSETLDRNELREALAEMGKRPTEDELNVLFAEWDMDGNGKIEPDEFDHMVRQSLSISHTCACRVCVKRNEEAAKLEAAEVKAIQDAEAAKEALARKASSGSAKGPSMAPKTKSGRDLKK